MVPNTPSFKFVALDGGKRHCREGFPPKPDEQIPAEREHAQTAGKRKKKISKDHCLTNSLVHKDLRPINVTFNNGWAIGC